MKPLSGQMIHGPHPTLAAAKDAIKEASRAAYCRAAVPRMRERADKLRAEAGDLDARADQYVSLYGEGES